MREQISVGIRLFVGPDLLSFWHGARMAVHPFSGLDAIDFCHLSVGLGGSPTENRNENSLRKEVLNREPKEDCCRRPM